MSELCRVRQSEGYEVREDEGQAERLSDFVGLGAAEGKQSACPTLSVLAPPENRRIPGGSPDPLRRRKFHIICFRQKAESKFTTLRLLSKRDPLRWALVW